MSFLLETNNYLSVHALFEEMTCHLAVATVLAGTLPGRIYVDDRTHPETAILIPSNQHRVYMSGEPSSRLLAEVIHQLFTESHEESYGCVLYYDPAHTWPQTIEQVLQKQETIASWRQFYRLGKPSLPTVGPLPEQITIALIDGAIVKESSLTNRQELLEEICSESPSLEHFFQQKFGFCARDGDRLVGWCLAEYHEQGRYELGIETLEGYQRQGIATHLASAVIKHAFAQGATEIGWHCWAKNMPSVATALKLGFEKVFDYPVYYCEYRQAPA